MKMFWSLNENFKSYSPNSQNVVFDDFVNDFQSLKKDSKKNWTVFQIVCKIIIEAQNIFSPLLSGFYSLSRENEDYSN